MYTKEDAETHKKIMKAIHKDMKRPRKWPEFHQLQKQIQSAKIKHFDQASQNMQTDWETAFINSLYGLQFKIILIANRGETKRLKILAKQVLDKISDIIDEFVKKRDEVFGQKKEFIISSAEQLKLLRRVKDAFKINRKERQ